VAEHDHPVDPQRVAAARARLIDAEEAARLAGLLGLLADPVRARVLYALDLVDELCVGDIALALGATEDSVGYGLRVLRTAGLVTTRKQGRVVFYRLSDGFPEPLR
jgi:ArsR family transcriptional regulator, lead/cadmium/zinc/bismuth-responsive transcriptional repressor